jgi:acyl carrier protein
VNWDSWRLGLEPEQTGAFEAALLEMSMTPAEGVETFKRVLSLEAGPQVLVSVSNLAARLERWVNLKPETPALPTDSAASRQPRPTLANDYVAPGNPLEQRIMGIWQDTLGIEQIGTHDNFFDLGGDSFLIVQIHTRLREQIKGELTVEKLFQYPTISTLAKHLSQEEAEEAATQQVRERTKQQQVLAREKQLMMKKRMKQ